MEVRASGKPFRLTRRQRLPGCSSQIILLGLVSPELLRGNKGVLAGVCQRVVSEHFPGLRDEEDALMETVLEFFEANLEQRFPDPDYVFDIYVTSAGKVWYEPSSTQVTSCTVWVYQPQPISEEAASFLAIIPPKARDRFSTFRIDLHLEKAQLLTKWPKIENDTGPRSKTTADLSQSLGTS